MTADSRRELRNVAYDMYEASYDSDYYVRVAGEDAGPGLDIKDPYSLTALCATPDSDYFNKLYFPVHDVSYEESGALRMDFADRLTSGLTHLTDSGAMRIVKDIRRGRAAYFESLEEPAPSGSIHVLGVVAVHKQAELVPFQSVEGFVVVTPQTYSTAVMVAPKPFLDVLLEKMPIDTAMDNLDTDILVGDDEALRELYSVISEHATEQTQVPTQNFEVFKAFMAETVDMWKSGESIMTAQNIATVALGVSLLPAKYTHPVFQRELFGPQTK